MANYAILRTAKIKTLAHLAKASNHNARTARVANAQPELSTNNSHEGAAVQKWREMTEKITVRKNGVLAIEVLCGHSAEVRPPADWHVHCRQWVATQFGGEANILAASYHADEKTPHSHFLVIPIDDRGKLNCRKFLGGASKLEELQDSFAVEVGAQFGLERGVRGSKSRHVPPSEFRKAALGAAESAVPIQPLSAISALKSGEREKHARDASDRIAAAEALRASAEVTARADRQRAIRAEEESLRLRQDLKLERTKLREMDLEVVMSTLGYDAPRKEGSEMIYNTERGHVSVSPTKQLFALNWEQWKGGRGAIDLVLALAGGTVGEACRLLADIDPQLAVSSLAARMSRLSAPALLTDAEKLAKQLRPGNAQQIEVVRRYLVEERGIDAGVVNREMEEGRIVANDRGGVAFLHTNNRGEIVGAEIRGTRSDFKGFAGTKTGSFTVGADRGIPTVVESAIDALSLAQMHEGRGRKISSVAGSAVPLHLGPVVVAFDNDDAGDQGYTRARSAGQATGRLKPTGAKDWNALLLLQTAARKLFGTITARMKQQLNNFNRTQHGSLTRNLRKNLPPAAQSVSRI